MNSKTRDIKLKPKQYLDVYFPGSRITTKTVINWIKAGRLAGEKTPTGRWLVIPNKQPDTFFSNQLETKSIELLNKVMGGK